MVEIIEQLPRLEGDLLFSISGKIAVSDFYNTKVKLDGLMREQLGILHPWVWHDLRRTAKTLMSKARVQPHISELVLGHSMPGLQGVYDRWSYATEKREALETLAGKIEQIVNPTANVVPLRA